MFDNIGGKIKGLAKLSCYASIGIAVVIGLFLIATGEEEMIIVSVIMIAVVSLLSWIGSFLLYGFG